MKNNPYTLEVCACEMQSIQAAIEGGAHRIELCEHIEVDGLTPSPELVQKAVNTGIPIHVLIRPSIEELVYSPDRVVLMEEQVEMARQAGARGIVVGALDEEGHVDCETIGRLKAKASPMSVTFHRAFDVCSDPHKALEDLIGLGIDRLLTSGQAMTAEMGIPLINELVRQADGRIIIMPGSGVNAQNAAHILQETGVRELHGTLRKDSFTDLETVKRIVQIMESRA